MADLNGEDYRALVELTNKAGTVVAAVGATCELVDPSSLGWLLRDGLIEPIPSVEDEDEPFWKDEV